MQSFSIRHEAPVTRAGLVLWLDLLAGLKGRDLLRVKGVFNVEGEPVAVHAVQRIVHEPVPLPAWPDEERASRIVFITRGIARAAIEKPSTFWVTWRPRQTARRSIPRRMRALSRRSANFTDTLDRSP